jgi:U3 small nucleolar RNA-associated protein 7
VGDKFATAGIDRKIKLWDPRNFRQPLAECRTRTPVNHIALSQKNSMAVALGDVCEIFRTSSMGEIHSIDTYLRHRENGAIKSLEFAPYEDVLGIGSSNGFCSILVPGCGEANFDALEQNPFRTKMQRREHEVKALLEKIPADLITLNAADIVGVDLNRLEEKLEAKPEVKVRRFIGELFKLF